MEPGACEFPSWISVIFEEIHSESTSSLRSGRFGRILPQNDVPPVLGKNWSFTGSRWKLSGSQPLLHVLTSRPEGLLNVEEY